jgi:hypothetical protein
LRFEIAFADKIAVFVECLCPAIKMIRPPEISTMLE